jgi:signal peptidase II
MRGRLSVGLPVAVATLVLDQLSKWWVLERLFALSEPITPASRAAPVQVTSFFDIALVWNFGVSFGFMGGDSALARWGLAAVAIAIVAWLLHWCSRTQRLWQGLAIGLVIGGAIGNVVDRLRFGAVADFLHFHAMGYSFWVFNVADSAITVGVVLLLIDGLFADRRSGVPARHGGTS